MDQESAVFILCLAIHNGLLARPQVLEAIDRAGADPLAVLDDLAASGALPQEVSASLQVLMASEMVQAAASWILARDSALRNLMPRGADGAAGPRTGGASKVLGRAPVGAPCQAPPPAREAPVHETAAGAAEAREGEGPAVARIRSCGLARDMELHLEREKEAEREREGARKNLEEGRRLAVDLERLKKERDAAREEHEKSMETAKPWWPVEEKQAAYDACHRWKALEEEMARTFGRAQTAFHQVLEFQRDHKDARRALADLYWSRFVLEEEAGNRKGMALYESLVRAYNDGAFDARLKGDGTISVGARAYPCPCLAEGRVVEPEELAGSAGRDGSPGHHPFSGRALGCDGAGGLSALEPESTVRLNVHGADCETTALRDADVWLWRCEEQRRMLVPVHPGDVGLLGMKGGAPPEGVLDAAYPDDSPFRPGEGLYLGKTPVPWFSLPMGTYLLVLHHEGYVPLRVPVHIGRLGRVKVDPVLFREEEVPDGFVVVPAGPSPSRGDTIFLQRYPVRSDEYLAYLNELSREDADASMARVPREGATGHPLWFWAGDGTWVVPTAEWLGKAPAGVRAAIARLPASHGEWEDAWPVLGLSWEDALHYAAWRRKGEGYAFTLPSDREWEGAARGADGRAFPWGDSREWTYANSCVSSEGGAGPASVDRFPTDESPFGVRGMAGNAADPCLNDPGGKGAGLRTFRGGTWRSAGSYDVLGVHHGGPPDAVGETQTIRLAVWPRLRDRGPDTG